MKPEPLKGKEIRTTDTNEKTDLYLDIDIKSAVEWLKEEKGICNVCFKKPNKKCIKDNHIIVVTIDSIDLAFEDVM